GLTRISVGGTFKPLKGLTIDADYTYTSTNEHLNQTGGGTMAYDFWALVNNNLNYINYQPAKFNKARWYSYWSEINTGKLFATYLKNIGDHSFKVIAGSDIELYKNNSQSSERSNLIDPDFGSIALTTGTPLVDGSNNHWSTLGFFGRVNYAYQNKYLLELNGRYDGSSRFPVNDLWGFFPSMSVGYVLTEESFMKTARPYLSFLKLRASYGSVGNQALNNSNPFLSKLDPSFSGWLLPSGNTTTLSTPGALSPVLTWETVKTVDVGMDARFLDNKLGVSFDWYQRTTSNMISQGASLPSSYGTSAPKRNFGELQGKGWELALDFSHTLPNGIHFTVTGTLSDAVEKITKFANATKTLPAVITPLNEVYYEGMTIGEIWGYETDGLLQESDFSGQDPITGRWKYNVPSQTKLESGNFIFGPGDVKYKDLNGDGTIYHGTNSVDSSGDKKIIGNSTPRYQYGFRIDADWKGFDIGIYIQGVAKRDLWASGPIVFPGFRAAEGWSAHQMDYWTPDNTGAFYPRPTDYSATVDRWNFLPQTRYMLNLSYLRVKNVSLGYALPKQLISKARIQRVRVYVSAENLITFDKLGNIPIDPEVDFSQVQIEKDRAGFGRVYPYRTTISAGLQVTF
ncbi:MAG TPA: SusC/RagA family TonB-linked outer membrane protein, partial [Niastella sp.]